MTIAHASDCALHNAPAMEPGPCDCGVADQDSAIVYVQKIGPFPYHPEGPFSMKRITREELAERFPFSPRRR